MCEKKKSIKFNIWKEFSRLENSSLNISNANSKNSNESPVVYVVRSFAFNFFICSASGHTSAHQVDCYKICSKKMFACFTHKCRSVRCRVFDISIGLLLPTSVLVLQRVKRRKEFSKTYAFGIETKLCRLNFNRNEKHNGTDHSEWK